MEFHGLPNLPYHYLSVHPDNIHSVNGATEFLAKVFTQLRLFFSTRTINYIVFFKFTMAKKISGTNFKSTECIVDAWYMHDMVPMHGI